MHIKYLDLFKKITLLNITKFVLYVLVVELIIGGGGRYLVLPFSLSIRMVLIGLGIILWMCCLFRKQVKISNIKKEVLFFSLFMGLFVPIMGSIVGFLEGNNIRNIFADANGYVFYFYIIIFASIFNSKEDLKRLFYVFLGSILIWGIFSLMVFILSSVHILDIRHIGYILKKLGYGGIIGIMPNKIYRFFTEGSLFLQVGLAFIWGTYLFKKDFTFKKTSIFILGTFLSLLVITITYTRGFWLAVIAEVLAFITFINFKSKLIFISTLLFLFFSSIFISSYIFHFSLTDYYRNRLLSSIPANLDLLDVDQIPSESVELDEKSNVDNKIDSSKEASVKTKTSKDVKELAQEKTKEDDTRSDDVKKADPYSAQYRVEMYKILIEKIKNRPILGYGFGKNFEELEGNYSYELSYLDMITKFGIPAFLIWLIILSYFLFLTLFKWLREKSNQLNYLMLSFTIGIGSILVTGFFNPFLVSSTGVLSIVLYLCFLNFQLTDKEGKSFKL
ncbi:hypothetical protein A2X44_01230 [candidate division CPR3 bacterium GWF2_35_18]|uniref:O-antigen ligase-related domain-containing protein n=1 Tax=candidate division CPR3 bacterium GW2011_GWF2_35_18 TaxID=1618350 RepID=A0A0G0C2K7_UNCC3|nr:MAG: hypothetical protein UR67_C0001G0225 [candidate division CPR3 bacterium GW2011_GWF2_35_18]OGB63524.1 MAG: hypothetical protein A2X44_01230 [candidate division CPR3 bacterium GWF2_35_18]OGB64633.1 MAG: hypothetical protein A2250_03780 [candidate division CPR3 bacterium RIFOXYA2_FULL_35_13]